MSQGIDVSSKFQSNAHFIPTYHNLKITQINFKTKSALCDLYIDGKIYELVNNCVRFTSVLPVINEIQFKLHDSWFDVSHEYLYDDLNNSTVENEVDKLVNKHALYSRAYNMDDEFGRGNLHVYLPTSVIKRVKAEDIVTFRFKFYFMYGNTHVSEYECDMDFDSYYLPIFCTPFDMNIPSGGYRICSWLPSLTRSYAATPWEISISTPRDMIAICSGTFVDVRPISDTIYTIWRFSLTFPSMPGMISIIVGKFENIRISSNVVGYSSPGNVYLLESTLAPFPEFISFFIKYLSITFSFELLNIVFHSRAQKIGVFSNLLIFPTALLTPRSNIVQINKNCLIFATALCEFIFGNMVLPINIADTWILCALNRFIFYQFLKSFMGACEYKRLLKKEQKHACKFPNSIVDVHFYLAPHVFLPSVLQDLPEITTPASALQKWCLSSHPRLLAHPHLWKSFVARCGLSFVSIEKQVTSAHFIHILRNVFSLTGDTTRFRISTESFFNLILNVTGKDIYLQMCRNWLSISRPLLLTLEYAYNRRKSSIEATFTNDDYGIETKVPVSVSVTVQESDGAFEHSLQLNRDAHTSPFEINTQSTKLRRSSHKRRVLTENGKEIDIEMIHAFRTGETTSLDNPVLWVRINPDQIGFYGDIRVNQLDSAWYYQAAIESNPASHLGAVKMLKTFPFDETIGLLCRLIKMKPAWWRIRAAAFDSLVAVHNQLSTDDMIKLDKDLNPIDLYRIVFGHPQFPEIPRINDFSNVAHYLFQISAIRSLSKLKMTILKDISKPRVFLSYELLRSLYEYNDNSSNTYDDCCYQACILTALGDSLNLLKNDLFQDACTFVLNESVGCIKLDELNKYVHGCFSHAALLNLLKLQKLKFIPFDSKPFVYCSLPGINERLRILSIQLLCEYVQLTKCSEEYRFILDIIVNDPNPLIQRACIKNLIKYPPFKYGDDTSELMNAHLQNYLYILLQSIYHNNPHFEILHLLSDLYHIMYGNKIPQINVGETFNQIDSFNINDAVAHTKLDHQGLLTIQLNI